MVSAFRFALSACANRETIPFHPELPPELLLEALIKYVYVGGVISAIIGFARLLRHIDSLGSVGPLSVEVLTSILYSILIAEVIIRPMLYRIRMYHS
jgi:flagellar motor component MotA